MPPTRCLAVLAVLVTSLLAGVASSARDAKHPVSPRHAQWLDEVALIMTKEEKKAFLALEKEYQRDGFIVAFWDARDPEPNSERNRFRETYYARREEAVLRFRDFTDERSNIYVLNGEPHEVINTDCGNLLWPLEIWYYAYSDRIRSSFAVLFWFRAGGGPAKMWRPTDGVDILLASGPARGEASGDAACTNVGEEFGWNDPFYCTLAKYCGDLNFQELAKLIQIFQWSKYDAPMGVTAASVPPRPDREWLRTFHTFSTDLPKEALPLEAELALDFAGRYQNRTVVNGLVTVRAPELVQAAIDAGAGLAFDLNGEVIIDERLLESFRYHFDLPTPETADVPIPLVFERYLRPGEYEMVVRLMDTATARQVRMTATLDVPKMTERAPGPDRFQVADDEPPLADRSPTRFDETGAEITDEAPAVPARPIELVPPEGEIHVGPLRVEAIAHDPAIKRVVFYLDDKQLLSKSRPPYSVEVRLGSFPRPHTLRAVALDATKAEVATDQLVLNPPPHRFEVRLIEPRPGPVTGDSVLMRADVAIPEGRVVDLVDFWIDDRKVGTLYQPPWVLDIPLRGFGAPVFARAVATLSDGSTTEDVVSIGSMDLGEQLDVDVVELYTSVVDGGGRPIQGLAEADFTVSEDGKRQEIVRFEQVTSVPLHVALLVDTSASMVEEMPAVREAALQFFQKVVTERDRAAVIAFADRPRLLTKFTGHSDQLGVALASLRAARGTALYDSMIFALQYFQGIQGKRALIVFSDGEDENSRSTTFDEALDFARYAGVAVYTVSFGGLAQRLDGDRTLGRFANETGGQPFSLRDTSELAATYRTIEEELRSQYLLVYQPPANETEGFRAVEVSVRRPGARARTIAGYYP